MNRIFYKIALFIVLLCFLAKTNSGQNIDSLMLNLQYVQDTTTKIDLYFKIANYLFIKERNSKEAEKYLLEAKKIAEDNGKPILIIRTNNELGVHYRNLSRYSEALINHNEAFRLANEIDNKPLIAKTLNNLGVVYRRLDDNSKAAEYHLKALKLAEEIKDTFNISVSENSLGNIYSRLGRYNEALNYFNKALQLSISLNNPLGQAINLNNIGEVYEFSRNYEKAKEYYSKSLEINKRLKNEKGIAISLNSLGKILLYTGFPITAYKNFSEAAIIDRKIGDKKFIVDGYLNLGSALIILKKYDEAKQCIYQGIKIAQETNSKIQLQLANEELSTIYKEKNDYKAALSFFQKSTMFKDSVLNEKNSRTLATIQTLYETEKKEKEIQILKQKQEIGDKKQEISEKENKRQKYFNYSLTLGLFLSMVLIVVVYQALLTKRRANKLLSKQKDEIESQKEKIEQQTKNIELKNQNLEEATK